MAAEDDIDGFRQRYSQSRHGVRNPPCARLSLFDSTRRNDDRIGCSARQNHDGPTRLGRRKRAHKITIVLCDAAATAESLGNKGEYPGLGIHAACILCAGLAADALFRTARDQGREAGPFVSAALPTAPYVPASAAFTPSPAGTPTPTLPRGRVCRGTRRTFL